MSDRLVLVSADGHAGPPIADYRPYIDAEWLDEFDRFVVEREEWRSRAQPLDGPRPRRRAGRRPVRRAHGGDVRRPGGGRRAAAGAASTTPTVATTSSSARASSPRCSSPTSRTATNRRGARPSRIRDTTPQLRLAGARAFNRWLADFCAELPGRRAGVAIVQPHDIDVAVREVQWVRQAGLASVMLPTGDFELPSYSDPRFDPLWAACVDQGCR